jgi:hypothetical protein
VTAVLRFLDKQSRFSCREISKAVDSPWQTTQRVLDDLGLRFFASSWLFHSLSDDQKTEMANPSQYMLDITQRLGPNQ